MRTAGLYIHTPFCKKKCGYCDFYSVVLDQNLALLWQNQVVLELQAVLQKYPDIVFDTVYIGGGTPSLLDKKILKNLIKSIFECGRITPREFTIEVNPAGEVDFLFFKDLGIDRVSVGVQSLNDKILRDAGRLHTAKEAILTLQNAAKAFKKVSADLILGLEGDSIDNIKASLDGIFPYVNHISMYILKLSKNVPLYKKMGDLDDDFLADLYEFGYSHIKNNAYERYEISNFASDSNAKSIHNMKYWTCEEYIGLGPAAASFIDGIRYQNKPSLTQYLKGRHSGACYYDMQRPSKNERLFEEIMLGLRLSQGIDIERLNKKYQIDFLTKYKNQITKLESLLTIKDGFLAIKEQKMLLESFVAGEFLGVEI